MLAIGIIQICLSVIQILIFAVILQMVAVALSKKTNKDVKENM